MIVEGRGSSDKSARILYQQVCEMETPNSEA